MGRDLRIFVEIRQKDGTWVILCNRYDGAYHDCRKKKCTVNMQHMYPFLDIARWDAFNALIISEDSSRWDLPYMPLESKELAPATEDVSPYLDHLIEHVWEDMSWTNYATGKELNEWIHHIRHVDAYHEQDGDMDGEVDMLTRYDQFETLITYVEHAYKKSKITDMDRLRMWFSLEWDC